MDETNEPQASTSVFWPHVRRLFLENADAEQIYRPVCAICTSTIVLKSAEEGDASMACPGMVITPCGHVIGLGCLRTWYETDPTAQYRCPICRQSMQHEGCGHHAELFTFSGAKDAQQLPRTIPEGGLFSTRCGLCRLNDFLMNSIGTILPPLIEPGETARSVGVVYGLTWSKLLAFSNRISQTFEWHGLLCDETAANLASTHECIRVQSNEEMKLCIQKCIDNFLDDNRAHYWEPSWASLEVTTCELTSRVEDLI